MASVTGMTAEKIDQLMDDMVIAVEVDDNGQLIYTKRSGEQLNAGSLTSSTAAVEQAYPVNSLFMCTVPTNPATLLGIGTWARFGKGRTLISLDEAQTEFDSVEEVGGAKEITLTTQQIPAHTHTGPLHSHTTAAHTHSLAAGYNEASVQDGGSNTRMDDWFYGSTTREVNRTGTTGSGGGGPTSDSGDSPTGATGGGQPHSNLPPYIVVYIWKRTA